MEADKKFESKTELEEWLKARGVDKEDVAEAAEKLFAKGFNKPSTLIGITVDELKNDAAISIPVAQHLSNKLEKQQKQQQEYRMSNDALDSEIRSFDFSCVFLTETFLNENNLHFYVAAAKACSGEDDVEEYLTHLRKATMLVEEKKPALFTAVVAPTGTGKTQLAVTAALENKGDVRYVLCDTGASSDLLQPVYEPHVDATTLLLKALRHFKLQYSEKLDQIAGANAYLNWFSKVEVLSPLATLLHRIIFPSATQGQAVSLGGLRQKVIEEKSRPLVFLDEVPPRRASQHAEIVLVRDLLRAIGISPILMSTHSGAQNAISSGSGSSYTDEDPKWCNLITRLPRFHSSKPVRDMSPYFSSSERPLVAKYISEMARDSSIDDIVRTIRLKLQTKKPGAWTTNPVFQLCQLFRTSSDSRTVDQTTHRLVGEHFGYLVNPSNPTGGRHALPRSQAGVLACRVQMVVPRDEPVLYSVLVSWSTSSLTRGVGNEGGLFPLVDKNGKAISVRAAYDANASLFKAPVATENANAISLEGKLLEVTSLASVCLASMNSDEGVGKGVLLPKFLSCIFYFMQMESLDAQNIDATSSLIASCLRNYPSTRNFEDMRVPCCSSADSPYPHGWRQFEELFRGKLKGPRDAEMRDGWVGELNDDAMTEDHKVSEADSDFLDVLQIECKNYLSGVDKRVFSDVVTRVRPNCKISILFASSLNNVFTGFGSWEKFTDGVLDDSNEIAFLTLSGKGVSWLSVERGQVSLAPTDKTTLLFVIVETGPVGT